MLKEFKKFIARGNVMDLAVGVIMGSAFSSIVTSLVNNILMPIIGVIIGGHDFSSLAIKVGNANIQYGLFIQSVLDFLIVAFCIFIMVKAINNLTSLTKKKEEKQEEAKKEENTVLLEEIRDLLKEEKKESKKAKVKKL